MISHLSPVRGLAVSIAAVAACLAGLAPAVAAPPEGVTVSDQWMRLIVPARPAAGYFTLTNDGDADVALTGVTSNACASAMLHRSVKKDGQDRMEMVMKAEVPAHGQLEFAPGGYHVMCMQPKMKVGDKVNVTLEFSNGATLAAPFPVRNAAGQ